jgi:hypothetical protein
MILSDLIGPAVVAAIVSSFVTVLGTVFSNRVSKAINAEKIASEKDLAERKFGFEVDLAERRFRYEQAIHNYRRTVEFGEELLASFYKLRDTVRSIRAPFSWGDESAERKRRPNETEAEANHRDGYYAPIARIRKNSDFLSDLSSKKYRAQAIFRSEIHTAFELAVEVVNSVHTAASMLIDNVGEERADVAYWRGLEKEIWNTSPRASSSPYHRRSKTRSR